MQLIIVYGQSATGKTTLATRLAKDLGYDVFLKDAYKEARFDASGKKLRLREASEIEADSWQAIYDEVAAANSAGRPLIIEGNFKYKQRESVRKALRRDTGVVEIFCFARGWLPFTRYVSRNRKGERHQGHFDHLWYVFVFWEVFLSKFGINAYRPLRLSDAVIEVDTSDFKAVDYKRILRYVTDRR